MDARDENCGVRSAISTEGSHRKSVERAIACMRSNLASNWDSDLSLAALSREACYSTSHFIQVFTKVTGATPHHFLTSLRMQRAKELLQATTASVTDVGLEVGYESPPTFSRTFRAYVGLSPVEFREIARHRLTLADVLALLPGYADDLSEEDAGFRGQVLAPGRIDGVIFVGIFRSGVPEGRPETGRVLLDVGYFSLDRTPLRRATLLAAVLPYEALEEHPMSCAPFTLVGRKQCDDDQGVTDVTIHLRPVRGTDPPVVVAPQALLANPKRILLLP
jgi:AraC family transcriptional regulator